MDDNKVLKTIKNRLFYYPSNHRPSNIIFSLIRRFPVGSKRGKQVLIATKHMEAISLACLAETL